MNKRLVTIVIGMMLFAALFAWQYYAVEAMPWFGFWDVFWKMPLLQIASFGVIIGIGSYYAPIIWEMLE